MRQHHDVSSTVEYVWGGAVDTAQKATAHLLKEAFELSKAAIKPQNESPSLQKLAPHFWETLQKKDTDGITRQDIQSAFRTKKLSPEDAAICCLLRDHFDSFAKANSKEVKLGDLAGFATKTRRFHEKDVAINELERQSEQLFKATGNDLTGSLSFKNINTLVADPKTPKELRTAAEHMQKNFDQIKCLDPNNQNNENAGITIPAMQRYVQNWRNEGGDTWLVRHVESTIKNSTDPKLCRDLFADKSAPEKDIVPEAVKQGGTGDCYFVSALASLAQVNPEAIKNMIKDNGNGTYTVTFPYTPKEPITVEAPTNQELLTYARASEHGIWPAVMEKAYGQWCTKSIWRRNFFTNPKSSDQAQDNADGGSLLHHGLTVLTGRYPDLMFLQAKKPEELDTVLKDAFKEKRPVTACTGLKQADYYLPATHEYSVLAYDEKAQTVTIRNPWGSCEPHNDWGKAADGKDDGIFTLSLADFQKKFFNIGVARNAK